MRQHRPLTAAFQDVQNAAENIVQLVLAWLGDTPETRQLCTDSLKLFPADVTGVRFSLFHRLTAKTTESSSEEDYEQVLSTAETVDKIKENALSKGWVVSDVKPLHESVKKHGGKDLKPVMLVNLCQATHASNILEQDQNKKISVFMPCTISVYEKSDGKAYIGSMNAGLLGAMFGGKVAEVMKDVSADQQSFIAFAK